MATPASTMMLSGNAKSLPLNLLRARLSGASTAINIPALMSTALAKQQGSSLVRFLLGTQPTFGSAGDIEGINYVGVIFDPRFGGFGEMGRFEARWNQKYPDVKEDEEDDSDFSDDVDDADMLDDGHFNEEDDDDDDDWDDGDEDDDEKN